MPALGKLSRFFIYSNLFISICAVLMVMQTDRLVLHEPINREFIAFVFFASLCSYSFHWHLTPDMAGIGRLQWLRENRRVHTLFFIIGMVGSIITGISLLSYWPWLVLSAFITFLYSAPKIPHPWFRALRKVALGKTIFLAMVWMHVTTLLPLVISGKPWQTDFTLFCLGRFFLIYAICILFDYRDREYDASVGIRSLITKLSERGIKILFAGSLIIFFAVTLGLLHYQYSVTQVGILLLPGIITGGLYSFATRRKSDILYYFILDGLMALSAVIMLISGI